MASVFRVSSKCKVTAAKVKLIRLVDELSTSESTRMLKLRLVYKSCKDFDQLGDVRYGMKLLLNHCVNNTYPQQSKDIFLEISDLLNDHRTAKAFLKLKCF